MLNYLLASSTWDEKELEAIQRVIDSDMYSMNKYVAQYEKDFAAFFGSKYAVMTSSGSTANLLMIAALFFKKKIIRYSVVMKLSYQRYRGRLLIFLYSNMA